MGLPGLCAQEYSVRVLDADKFKQTQELQEECTEFVEKVQQLSGIVTSVVEAVDGAAARTEGEKLRAIGKRNQAVAEADLRRRTRAEHQAAVVDKQQELERLSAEYESLMKVKAQQDQIIANLSSATV